MNGTDTPNGARGFTLVELVTVMGILAILVALIVGAAQGVSDLAARKTTERILASLDSALVHYYEDWGKFPWYQEESDPDLAELLGAVAGSDPRDRSLPKYCPIPIQGRFENEVEAMLYATLNMRERNGPYMPAGSPNVKIVPFTVSWKYRVYVDAWGRPVHYFQPQGDSKVPLLMSEGRTKDFFDPVRQSGDIWPARSKADNLTNYNLDDLGVTHIQGDRKY